MGIKEYEYGLYSETGFHDEGLVLTIKDGEIKNIYLDLEKIYIPSSEDMEFKSNLYYEIGGKEYYDKDWSSIKETPDEVFLKLKEDLIEALENKDLVEKLYENIEEQIGNIAESEIKYGAYEVDKYMLADVFDIDEKTLEQVWEFAYDKNYEYETPSAVDLIEELLWSWEIERMLNELKDCAEKSENLEELNECIFGSDGNLIDSVTESIVMTTEDSMVEEEKLMICQALEKYPEEIKKMIGEENYDTMIKNC